MVRMGARGAAARALASGGSTPTHDRGSAAACHRARRPLHRECSSSQPSTPRTQRRRLAGDGGERPDAGLRHRALPSACGRRDRQPYAALGAVAWPDLRSASRRLRLALPAADQRHRHARQRLRAILHVASRPGAAVLLPAAGVRRRDGRRRAVRQCDPAGHLLGNDQHPVLSADRLLAPWRGGSGRRAHGVGGHLHRRPVPAGRLAAARRRRRVL